MGAKATGGGLGRHLLSVGEDRQINLLHDPVCFRQNLDDLLIMAIIIPTQRAAFAILQPFFSTLMGADYVLRTLPPSP